MEFDYCECGCHGYEASAGNIHFWLFWDLEKSFKLRRGHGHQAQLIKDCKSFEEAAELAKSIARDELKKMEADLKEELVSLEEAQPKVRTRLERV